MQIKESSVARSSLTLIHVKVNRTGALFWRTMRQKRGGWNSKTFFHKFRSYRTESSSGVRPTPNFSHIQQDLIIPKHLLSLKNPVEVKEAMFKVKTNKATGYDNITPRAIKESAEILCYPFSALFNRREFRDTSTMETQWSLASLQKGLLPNEIKLQTDNYTSSKR